jgi:transposase InsO family protein
LWVADFTYVMTWSGVVYVAVVIDVFSRRIVGWKADTTMRTELVLDTLDMAIWARDHAGHPIGEGQIHHNDAGSQYTSFAFTSRLLDVGVDASVGSVGSVGDGYDNALAETTIGLYKTELINRNRPWKTLADVELATLEYIDWYNNARLHSAYSNRLQEPGAIHYTPGGFSESRMSHPHERTQTSKVLRLLQASEPPAFEQLLQGLRESHHAHHRQGDLLSRRLNQRVAARPSRGEQGL